MKINGKVAVTFIITICIACFCFSSIVGIGFLIKSKIDDKKEQSCITDDAFLESIQVENLSEQQKKRFMDTDKYFSFTDAFTKDEKDIIKLIIAKSELIDFSIFQGVEFTKDSASIINLGIIEIPASILASYQDCNEYRTLRNWIGIQLGTVFGEWVCNYEEDFKNKYEIYRGIDDNSGEWFEGLDDFYQIFDKIYFSPTRKIYTSYSNEISDEVKDFFDELYKEAIEIAETANKYNFTPLAYESLMKFNKNVTTDVLFSNREENIIKITSEGFYGNSLPLEYHQKSNNRKLAFTVEYETDRNNLSVYNCTEKPRLDNYLVEVYETCGSIYTIFEEDGYIISISSDTKDYTVDSLIRIYNEMILFD